MMDQLTKENETLLTKVTAFRSGGIQLVSEEELNRTMKEQQFYCQNWKKIKREAKEMMDIISEQVDMNLKEFIKNLGLETDEDYGVDVNKILCK